MGFCLTESVQDENRYYPVFRTHQSENRLIKSESAASVPDAAKVKVENLYDYMGRRVRKTVSSGYSGGSYTTTNVTTFIYNGWVPIAEISDAGYTNYYAWGIDNSGRAGGAAGIGGLLSRTQVTASDTQTVFYCYDGQGNVCQLIDADDGSVEASYEWSPFGRPIKATGPLAQDNKFRWSTKYVDDETGLLNFGLRMYSPELGRWLSRDPWGEQGGLNLYGAFGNSPIIYIDPLGNVYVWDAVRSGLQVVGGGLVMWAGATMAVGGTAVGGPLAWAGGAMLISWGAATVHNGATGLAMALEDQGPPEPIQITAYSSYYQSVSGEPLSDTGERVVAATYYSVDIACACYTVSASWATLAQKVSKYSSYAEVSYLRYNLIRVRSVINIRAVATATETPQIIYDFYSIFSNIEELEDVITVDDPDVFDEDPYFLPPPENAPLPPVPEPGG